MWWQVSFYRRLSSNGNIFLTLKRFMHLSVRSSLRKPSTTNALTTTVFNDYHTHIRRAMTLKFLPFFIFLYFLFIFSPLFKKMLSRPNEVLFTAFWKRKRKRKRKRWKQHFWKQKRKRWKQHFWKRKRKRSSKTEWKWKQKRFSIQMFNWKRKRKRFCLFLMKMEAEAVFSSTWKR